MGVFKKEIENIIENSMNQYSAYVLLQRAIIDYRDGLKPVHRRILYTMYMDKDTKLTKSQNVEGRVMKIHPHSGTYPSIVNMVQTDRNIAPMITGKGSFGQFTSRDLQAAAPRYTEVKISPVAIDMMKNFNKGAIKFIPNFDGKIMIPEVLPVKFPFALAYANSGIGVGFSSDTPSFNMMEVSNAIEQYIKTGKKTMLVPDFATRGFIIKDEKSINQINNKGNGSITLRAKMNIDKNEINVTELPYGVTREVVMEKIVSLVKEGKLKEVVNVKDRTGLKGMCVGIICHKNSDMNMVEAKLLKLTTLETSYSANMNMLIDGKLRVLSVWDLLDAWIKWRDDCIQKELIFDYNKAEQDYMFKIGLLNILDNLDKVISLIRHSPENEVISRLMKHFNLNQDQAEYIANLKLRYINREWVLKNVSDIDDLKKKAEEIKAKAESSEVRMQILMQDVHDVAKNFGRERQTQIIESDQIKKIQIDEFKNIRDYTCSIAITKQGYIYKNKNDLEELTLKPQDKVQRMIRTSNKGTLLIFSKDNNCFKLPINDVPSTNKGDVGKFIPVLLGEQLDIAQCVSITDETAFVFLSYTDGHMVKIPVESYAGNRKKLKGAWQDGYTLLGVDTLLKNEEQVIYEFHAQKTARLKSATIKVDAKDISIKQLRTAKGSRLIRRTISGWNRKSF
jgi:DNA gyrase subunit A